MELTTLRVVDTLDKAVDILTELGMLKSKPKFTSIKLTNAGGYWGQIRYHKDWNGTTYELRVSKKLFSGAPNEEALQLRLEETLIHELIHTLPRCFNHGYWFKCACNKVNIAYPKYNICRTTSAQERGFTVERKTREINYVIECELCGAKSRYQRRPRYADCLQLCYCGRCHASGIHLKLKCLK